MTGWACPRCGRSYSPWVYSCWACESEASRGVTSSGTSEDEPGVWRCFACLQPFRNTAEPCYRVVYGVRIKLCSLCVDKHERRAK